MDSYEAYQSGVRLVKRQKKNEFVTTHNAEAVPFREFQVDECSTTSSLCRISIRKVRILSTSGEATHGKFRYEDDRNDAICYLSICISVSV